MTESDAVAESVDSGVVLLTNPPDLSTHRELPAHARIATWLESLILSGELDSGDKLPRERDLAEELNVSR